ncbi:MAG: hypothetical protein JWO81_1854 [Alphaproteobacteria bacterium]|nr:hypothetical protein [Alphaproteobacteria bacterium]
MSDYDRDPERMRETERTTIIHDSRDRGGGSGALIAVVLLVVVLAILFFLFRGSFSQGTHDGSLNVNVAAPNVKMPDINVKVPDVKVTVPKIDIKTEDAQANKSAGK